MKVTDTTRWLTAVIGFSVNLITIVGIAVSVQSKLDSIEHAASTNCQILVAATKVSIAQANSELRPGLGDRIAANFDKITCS